MSTQCTIDRYSFAVNCACNKYCLHLLLTCLLIQQRSMLKMSPGECEPQSQGHHDDR